MKKCVNVAKVKRCRIRRQGLESYKSTSPRSVSRAKGSFASNPTNRHQHYAFGSIVGVQQKPHKRENERKIV